jgi:nucleoside-diphosphate-sugar epimerase
MIFVTGGAGLVGSALLKQLLKGNEPIRALYRNSMPVTLSKEEQDKIEWIQGDVLDTSLLTEVLRECSHVYHSAAVVSFHPGRREQMYKINIEGTANMVNACLEHKVQKLVHVSSVAALGRNRKKERLNESTEWSEETNNSHYGKTKYLSELEVWRGISEGLNAVMVNPSIILGEGSWENGSSAIFKKCWNEFPWFTEGSTGFVDVQDVAAAMIELMHSTHTGERYILCNEHAGYRDLFSRIALAFHKQPPSRKAPEWLMELLWRWEAIKSKLSKQEPLLTQETVNTANASTLFDNSKIKEHLPGFTFTPLDDTIERTCRWLKAFYHLS